MTTVSINLHSEILLPNYVQENLNRICVSNGFVDYSMKVRKGSQIVDGFSSNIWSVTIIERNDDKRLHVVCKVAKIPEKEIIFKREADFYTKLMPFFVKFQEEKGLSKIDQFLAYPKCYGITYGNYAIILEDLCVKNFKLWPKVKTLPIENVRLAMHEIGKFHGISIALKDQKPNEFSKFEQFTDIYKRTFKLKNILAYFTSSHDYAIKSFKRNDFKTIMSDIRNNVLKYFDKCLNEKSAKYFGVICHGDFWNNNILYYFNENVFKYSIHFMAEILFKRLFFLHFKRVLPKMYDS